MLGPRKFQMIADRSRYDGLDASWFANVFGGDVGSDVGSDVVWRYQSLSIQVDSSGYDLEEYVKSEIRFGSRELQRGQCGHHALKTESQAVTARLQRCPTWYDKGPNHKP
eukprot:gene31783-6980_t